MHRYCIRFKKGGCIYYKCVTAKNVTDAVDELIRLTQFNYCHGDIEILEINKIE